MSQTQTQTPYAPPQGNSAQTSPATSSSTSRTLVTLAFVFAAVAVFFIPIVFGPAGIICASIAMTKRDPLGKWALAASIAGLVIGIVLSYIVLHAHS